ncbi:MAG: hypothetical protein QNJ85_18000 [Gammaproteobacteria bacterium]|nr:hypothetical protein [Gammaproteobacteria bacterium]
MTLEQLDNLVRIGKLKREPPDPGQVDGFISRARERLAAKRSECEEIRSEIRGL